MKLKSLMWLTVLNIANSPHPKGLGRNMSMNAVRTLRCSRCNTLVTATLISDSESVCFGRRCARYEIPKHRIVRDAENLGDASTKALSTDSDKNCNGIDDILSFEEKTASPGA